MNTAILDPAAGISGDMTLGALLDAGANPAWLKGLPGRLGLPEVGVRVARVERCSVQATKVDFVIPGDDGTPHAPDQGHAHGRHVSELIDIVERAPLSDWVRQRAVEAIRLLGQAEGRIHGVAAEKVHLHEVGALDAVLDIVGGVVGFEQLGIGTVYHLPVAIGGGWVRAAHGHLPVPAPATAILLEGMQVRTGGPVAGEATTPTGAALLRVLSSGPPPPSWRIVGSGWGAGTRDPSEYPNALRVILAEVVAEAGVVEVISADLDDMDPEYLEPLRQAVTLAGALDCTIWATQGKKGRIGFRLEALAAPDRTETVIRAVFRNSTTAGLRTWTTTRRTLERRWMAVQMAPSVSVRVKLLEGQEGTPRMKPEYDDVLRAAAELDRPALEIARAARRLAEAQYAPEIMPVIGQDTTGKTQSEEGISE
jgi:uncharacterized protein (TIGR00299 family) protein